MNVMRKEQGEGLIYVAPDVVGLRTVMVNVYFVGKPGDGNSWVLVDAGLPFSASKIMSVAAERFGAGTKPEAIILTHGHFDHVGALDELLRHWDVPVYAHHMELPYLTGRSDYPPPDPTVGGGMMAFMSRFYSRSGIDLGERIRELPDDETVPGLEGWRWIHTPGHTPGHISLFREIDGVLIVGDAFVTTKQESMMAVMTQRQELHGPPAYFTPNWEAARHSVERLARLSPSIAAAGHGKPMTGEMLALGLERLAREFNDLATPAHGRYVRYPAIVDEQGVISIPPPARDPLPKVIAGLGIVAALLAFLPRTH